MSRSTVRARGQITLPPEVRSALRVSAGDDVEFDVDPERGTVLLRGLVSVPSDQAWFWAEAWQQGEREASAEHEAGEGTVYADEEELLASLEG